MPWALADGPHSWFVKASDNGGNETSSVTWTFTVDRTPPAAFDLVSPANNALTDASRPTLSWHQTTDATSGVDHYELWIDDARDQNVPTSACSDNVCSAQPSAAVPDGTHTWLVKAVDGAGNAQPSNTTNSVTIDATPPTAFSNASPGDGARLNDQTPTLSWTGSSDSGSGLAPYRVLVDRIGLALSAL